MKNKKLLYVLFPVTLIIWGYIIYKIFISVSGDSEVPVVMNEIEAAPQTTLIPDTFSLIAGYRDPFLGRMEEKKAPAVNNISLPKREEKVTAWPILAYGGMIKNQNSNKKLALLNINGMDNIMQAGDVKEGVRILSIFSDSVAVVMGKERKVVLKRK